jgi:hypothetical protein
VCFTWNPKAYDDFACVLLLAKHNYCLVLFLGAFISHYYQLLGTETVNTDNLKQLIQLKDILNLIPRPEYPCTMFLSAFQTNHIPVDQVLQITLLTNC